MKIIPDFITQRRIEPLVRDAKHSLDIKEQTCINRNTKINHCFFYSFFLAPSREEFGSEGKNEK